MAVYFEWTEDMTVGERNIDSQHQKLLGQVNNIISAVSNGAGAKEIEESLSFLDAYVKEHFSYEEEYMRKNNFPQIEEHTKYHTDFAGQYQEFKKKFTEGADMNQLLIEIEKFVGMWWIEHIGIEDRKYYEFIGDEVFE